jgi:glycosyltransferase involved in cell wall biosynthesis
MEEPASLLIDGFIPRAPVSPDTVSLARRDLRLVKPPADATTWRARVVIGITLHNDAATIRRALASALAQDLPISDLAILVLDDGSSDGWNEAIADLIGKSNVVVIRGHCGSAARARNAVLDYVDAHFPEAVWVARLDADDAFSTPHSVRTACEAGDAKNAIYVIGGNRLVRDGVLLKKTNPASQSLFNIGYLLELLGQMADGTAENELPSCNLLLRTRCRHRYADLPGAEDHRLVAQLLILSPERGAVLSDPFFADYSIMGKTSQTNRAEGRYFESRIKLEAAAKTWVSASSQADSVLGVGNEGIVIKRGTSVEKHFYPSTLPPDAVPALRHLLTRTADYLPAITFTVQDAHTVGSYAFEKTTPLVEMTGAEVRAFLQTCWNGRFVCLDVKRSNFQRKEDGALLMVDFGSDIREFTVDYFMDSAARLYAQSVLKWDDDELRRRVTGIRQEDALNLIPGFSEFYRDLMREFAESAWGKQPISRKRNAVEEDVTLLIKSCAMDARDLDEQVRHLVTTLTHPVAFKFKVLLIDPYEGPFLRQHCEGDYPELIRKAEQLKAQGWIDEIWIAPITPDAIETINHHWFELDCTHSHSTRNIPVSSQLWAFDQVATRYVLQCDVDVFVGRRDWTHDYLKDMLRAIQCRDVVCVAFNIPKPEESGFAPYHAPPGGYVPEVRCGLIDLKKLREAAPLPNTVLQDRLALSWYRALESRQHEIGLRTVRGGDPRTFYLHPANGWKTQTAILAAVRNRVYQAAIPAVQFGSWDLVGDASDWMPTSRNEQIVFLIKGRNTDPDKIRRCFRSLAVQEDRDFGIVVMDDGSEDPNSVHCLQIECRHAGLPITFHRNAERKGHLANIDFAVSTICTNPDSLIVILDMDDALLGRSVVSELRVANRVGHDVILAAPYRPEKPFKSYHPNFESPRQPGGGDVWIHLRSFKKALYDQLPKECLKVDGEWIPECTDYALMVPLVEIATSPHYLPVYLYWHERSHPTDPEARKRKDSFISQILQKPNLR